MVIYRAKNYQDMSRKAANIISAQIIMYILSIVLRQVFEFFSKPVSLFPLQRVGRMS